MLQTFYSSYFLKTKIDNLYNPQSYKLDCCLTNTDAHVTGGSEDGFIYFWDLVDASVVSRFRAHTSVVCFFTCLLFLEESCARTILKDIINLFFINNLT